MLLNLQETARLEEILRNITSREFRDFCMSLLQNRIGGPGSNLRISENLPHQRQTLLELLVHLDSVLLSGNALLGPLHQIASQPHNVAVRHLIHFKLFAVNAARLSSTSSPQNSFLPTMPDDHTSEVKQWLSRDRRGQVYSKYFTLWSFCLCN